MLSWNNSCQAFLLLLLFASDWSGRKTSRVDSEMAARVKPSSSISSWMRSANFEVPFREAARVKPSQPQLNWIEKNSSTLRHKGMVRLTGHFQWVVTRSELCGRVWGETGKTELLEDESRSKKLCGALKDAARVTPSRDHEMNQKSRASRRNLWRGGQGKTEPFSIRWNREADTSRINQKRATRSHRVALDVLLMLCRKSTHLAHPSI